MKDIAKIKAGEQKQLNRLLKEQKRSNYSWYYSGLLVFLILLLIVDTVATNCGNALKSSVVTEFFVEGQGISFSEGLSKLSLITSSMTLVSIFSMMMLMVSDKIGRKPMLLISAAGLVVGMLWIYFSGSFTMYVIGFALLTFFIGFDMHQLYIMEVAPVNKRATWQAYSQFFGQMSITAVGVMRLLNTDDGQLAWRNVYLIPAVLGIVVVILLAVFVRESDVFLNQRIAYLQTPYEERVAKTEEQAALKAQKKQSNGGLGAAYRYIFKNKQMLRVFLALLLFRFAIPAFATYYEPIMTSCNMSTDAVSLALIFMAVAAGFVRLSAGLLSDKLGRKKASVIYGIFTIVMLIGFIFTARANMSPVLVGLLLGANTGAYWTVGDQIILMMNESAPTAIRGTISSASGLAQAVVAVVSMVFAGIMINLMDLSIFCVIYGTVVLSVATIFLSKADETNGIDLSENDKL